MGEGNRWHRQLVAPATERLLAIRAGERALELACGNGQFARRLAELGAHVVACDFSSAQLECARRRTVANADRIEYRLADLTKEEDLAGLGAGEFDAAVCNMALMDIEDAPGAIREAGRVLRAGGRFVATIPHPCFDVPNASAWVVETVDFTTTVWRKVSRYREIAAGVCPWRGPSGQILHTAIYHRPLSWYVRTLGAAGFVVTAIEEPEPTEEFAAGSAQAPWIAQIPLHCAFEARKE